MLLINTFASLVSKYGINFHELIFNFLLKTKWKINELNTIENPETPKDLKNS
jgi:hypothetical protein